MATAELSAALRPDAATLLWVVDVTRWCLAGLLVTMGPSVTGSAAAGC
ncbi:hypothetical protein [Pseudonocardia sp. ICBG601]|nr:hypothetical protein [Pseudonocardia sp. ICBG601]